MHGPVTVTNDVTAGGKSLMTHAHGGLSMAMTAPEVLNNALPT